MKRWLGMARRPRRKEGRKNVRVLTGKGREGRKRRGSRKREVFVLLIWISVDG